MGFQPFQPSVTGFANPMTTAGDLIDGGTSGAAQRLAIGTSGQLLSVVSGAPAWVLPAASVSFSPSNPTGTPSQSALVSMGLGGTATFTPALTGKILVNVTGLSGTNTGNANVLLGGRYGTGTAPTGSVAATATNASPCVFTATGTAYANGQQLVLAATSSVPTGFTANTTYYVVDASGTSFSLSATSGGAAINSSSTGSGIYVAPPASGTRFGSINDYSTKSTGSGTGSPFAITAIIPSLATGTPVWFDLVLDTATAADLAFLTDLSFTITELLY